MTRTLMVGPRKGGCKAAGWGHWMPGGANGAMVEPLRKIHIDQKPRPPEQNLKQTSHAQRSAAQC